MKKNYGKMYSIEALLDEVESDTIDIEEEKELDEESQANSNDTEVRRLYVDKVDKSTSDLFRMIVESELKLQPSFQRKFVWDKKTMSKFIESLLLSIPIPTIFLAENRDDTYEVIDGQQRLTTIFSFMMTKLDDNKASNLPLELRDIEPLKLTGLETLKQYNGKKYEDLPDVQRKFNNVSIPVVIIRKDSTEYIKYDIFSRINSGSMKLNSQELLNVMYRGTLMSTLNEVATNPEVDELFGQRPVLKKRFGYHEILLRAKVMESFINKDNWSLQEVKVKNTKDVKDKTKRKYSGRLNQAVVEYLQEYKNDSEEANNLRKFIADSLKKVKIVFGKCAFRRIGEDSSESINKTVAELQMVVLSKFDTNAILAKKEEIRRSFQDFVKSSEDGVFTSATNNTSKVEQRYKWGYKVSEIIEEN